MIPAVQVLAHPLTQQGELPVSSLFVATLAVCLLAGAAYLLAGRARSRPAQEHPDPPAVATEPDAVPIGATRIVFLLTRLLGLALLVLAVVAGRFGRDDQLDNITPALVIGIGWPLLVIGEAALGRVWWWINPFDTLARVAAPLGAGDGAAGDEGTEASVWLAVPAAGLWVAYLTIWPNSLSPRSISNALLVYTVVTLAGCLAMGRRAWLARAEIFTVFLGWVARVRHGRDAWTPARGATVVLGVVAGGLLYGLVRDSRLLTRFSYGSILELALTLAVFGAATAVLANRGERRQHARAGVKAVALAMIPSTAALAIALGLARNRFTTSLQLLPDLVFDPLGMTPDLTGRVINARPLGHEGLLALQIAVLVAGHFVGVAVAARAAARGRASTTPMVTILPTLTVLALLLGSAVAAVAAT